MKYSNPIILDILNTFREACEIDGAIRTIEFRFMHDDNNDPRTMLVHQIECIKLSKLRDEMIELGVHKYTVFKNGLPTVNTILKEENATSNKG